MDTSQTIPTPQTPQMGDILSALQSLYNMPMSATAQAGLGLAQTGMQDQYNLGQGQLALGNTQAANQLALGNTQAANQLQEFNSNLAMQNAQQLWQQMMGGQQLTNQEQQQQFQNQNLVSQQNYEENPAVMQLKAMLAGTGSFSPQSEQQMQNFLNNRALNSKPLSPQQQFTTDTGIV